MPAGPKKLYEFHFRAGEAEGERFLVLVERLQAVKSEVVRDALILYLAVADTAPPDLTRHKLASYIEDAVTRLMAPPVNVRPPGPSAAIARPSRPRPHNRTHKRP